MYKIFLKPNAEKDLNRLDNNIYKRIKNKIEFLKENPRTIGSIKLTNMEVYRVRVGDYRIIYEIDDKKFEVTISRIKHRKDVYN